MKKLLLLAFHLGFLLPHLSSQSMAAYQKSAEEAFAIKDYPTAYIHAQKVLESDSNNIAVLKIAAESAVEVCEFKQADARLDQLESLNAIADYPEYWFYRAKSNHRRGLYEKAITDYDYFLEVGEAADPALKAIAEVKREECNAWLDYPLPTNSNTTTQFVADLSTPGQSDFAMPIYDKNIIVGKLTPPEQCECEKPCSDKMELYQRGTSGERDKLTLPKSFKNIGHITYANKGQRAYFTSCKCKDDNYTCEIYYADRTTGAEGWTKPVKLPNSINRPGYTATQPYYQEREGNGIGRLYYVSNYHKGAPAIRDLDVYYTDVQGNTCDAPVNVSAINTTGDEVTPFYHNLTNTLYFSSNGHKTLGGYDFDIFKYSPEGYADENCDNQNQASNSNIIPLDKPINSVFDDLYFSKEEDSERMVFSSNRNGHDYAELEHCCPDIFEGTYSPKVDIIVSVFCQGGGDCQAFEQEAIGNEEANLLQWTGDYELPVPERKNNVFTFRNVPLEKSFQMVAELTGYKPDSKLINTGKCDGEVIELDLFLEPEIKLSINFIDFCDEYKPVGVNNLVLLDMDSGSKINPSSQTAKHTYNYDLCPGIRYGFSTAGCVPQDSSYKFESSPENMTINTTCKSEDFAYTFKLYKSSTETIEDSITLYFDHDQPRPGYATGRDYNSFYRGYLNGSDYDQTVNRRYLALSKAAKEAKESARTDSTRIKEYEAAACNGDTNALAITNFFNEVTSNRDRLVSLSENVFAYYLTGYTITIDIEGAASGSGNSAWNNSLSSRRIATITQYFKNYFEEQQEEFDETRITYKLVPKGSSGYAKRANKYPRTGECRIYDVRAARDRNIKILQVQFTPPAKPYCDENAAIGAISRPNEH